MIKKEQGGDKMQIEKTLSLVLDAGAAMVRCGGETHRVEDTLYRMLTAFGFTNCNVWVVPSNLQATVTSPEGSVMTQIRHITGGGIDFETLDRLNTLSRWTCAEQPSPEEFAERLETIRTAPPQRTWITNLAGVLGGGGFALFFGCGLLDALIAAAASFLIITLIRRLSPKEGNPLILNFTISLLTELFIMLAGKVGLGEHTDRIPIGVVMLLISGLGATNGLRDLVHLDTISGLINIVASVTGAIGIALGIALPILLFRSGGEAVSGLNPNVVIQLLSGTAACVGFAIWFRVRGIKVFYCALGTFLSWGTYLLAYHLQPNAFYATLAASVVCGLYAQITARINKTPATIFTTICLLPLIPGSSLYYTVYGVVVRNAALSYAKGVDFGKTCFGIVLGFMVVEVANRFLWRRPH